MRLALLGMAVIGFGALGVLDLLSGDIKHGTAAVLLAIANALVLA
jgi:hypothetical protein